MREREGTLLFTPTPFAQHPCEQQQVIFTADKVDVMHTTANRHRSSCSGESRTFNVLFQDMRAKHGIMLFKHSIFILHCQAFYMHLVAHACAS